MSQKRADRKRQGANDWQPCARRLAGEFLLYNLVFSVRGPRAGVIGPVPGGPLETWASESTSNTNMAS